MAMVGPAPPPSYLKPSLEYACKCFFNHSAAATTPAAANATLPPVEDYFAVVNLATGLRVAAYNRTGAACPRRADPLQAVVRDASSPTGLYCACPDPSEMNAGNILTIPMVGIGIAVLGAVLSSLGQVTMKWVHTHNELRPLRERRIYFLNPLWYAALMTYVVSQVMTVLSYTSISQGENAVVGTLSLAANAVFARHFLGEAMTRLHYVGILFIAAGAVLVLIATLGVRCANAPEAVQEVAAAISPEKNAPFFAFVCMLGTIVVSALSIRRWGQWRQRGGRCLGAGDVSMGCVGWCTRSSPNTRSRKTQSIDFENSNAHTTPFLSRHSGGAGGGESGESGKSGNGSVGKHSSGSTLNAHNEQAMAMDNMVMSSSHSRSSSGTSLLDSKGGGESRSSRTPATLLRPMRQLGFGQDHYSEKAMLFVVIAATMGTISSFCASATVKLVTTQMRAFGESADPWILLAIFLVAVLSSMHYLNRGLESGQALMVVPGFFTLNTMLAMICSLLYQLTYVYLSALEIAFFITGMVFAVVGVIAMVWKEMHNDPDRMEQWAKRVAASPRHFQSREDFMNFKRSNCFPADYVRGGHTSGSGGAGRPPMYPTGTPGGSTPGAGLAASPNRAILGSNSVPIADIGECRQREQDITPAAGHLKVQDLIDPEYASGRISPMLSQSGSGHSSINSSSRPGSGPNSLKAFAPIAVGVDMVDALSNQGNRSAVPHSHSFVPGDR